MNAHALLTAQGWRGTGHSLHPTSDGNGLTHHILIKRNDDGRGLGSGKDQHKAEAWWLNAFDQALQGIDVGTASGGGSTTMKQTLRGGALEKITAKQKGALARYTGSRGLYSSFVRGGVLQGTVETSAATTTTTTGLPTPPDSGVASPAPAPAPGSNSSSTTGAGGREGKEGEVKETKEERRARREAKRLRKEGRRKEKEEAERRAAKKAEKKKKKAKKAERQDAGETKEERRARRDARRKRKEEKRRSGASSG